MGQVERVGWRAFPKAWVASLGGQGLGSYANEALAGRAVDRAWRDAQRRR